eukprot:scaffold1330_cov240-Pinguiococcus_pyrenoidosus.AAC.34
MQDCVHVVVKPLGFPSRCVAAAQVPREVLQRSCRPQIAAARQLPGWEVGVKQPWHGSRTKKQTSERPKEENGRQSAATAGRDSVKRNDFGARTGAAIPQDEDNVALFDALVSKVAPSQHQGKE